MDCRALLHAAFWFNCCWRLSNRRQHPRPQPVQGENNELIPCFSRHTEKIRADSRKNQNRDSRFTMLFKVSTLDPLTSMFNQKGRMFHEL
jgi:hypothetical protein